MEVVVKMKASNENLFNEVINAGLCTYCGACSGGCPYLVPHNGKIVLMDNCILEEGQCYTYCPRTYTEMDVLSQKVTGSPYEGNGIGTFKEIFISRSGDSRIKEKSQYGGIVTALLSLAFEDDIIDSAIMSKTGSTFIPEPMLVKNREGVLECAGSNYIASPVLSGLNKISKGSKEKLAIVTTPCQAIALAKMKNETRQNRVDTANIKLTIGLFCTWALSFEFKNFLQQKVDITKIKKVDIPPPPANRFDVYTSKRKISFTLEQLRDFIMPSCSLCLDMTSELADISVGSAEGIEGWNTVIVRNETGADFIKRAIAKGKIEINRIPDRALAHLKEAALLKKKRAVKSIIGKTGNKKKLLYLGISETIVDKLLS